MSLNPKAIDVPLRDEDGGTIRVGESNVTLDVVIHEFRNGLDPESIARAYSTLRVADVYAVIAYYLANQEAVDEYLRTRKAQAESLRQEIEAGQSSRDEFRDTLLKRRAQMEQPNASPTE
jgi:uncharacterized protein (DUF433 family)